MKKQQQNDLCTSAKSDQSPLCTQWVAKDMLTAKADLSLRWVHRSFCWFCHALPQVICDNAFSGIGRQNIFSPILNHVTKFVVI